MLSRSIGLMAMYTYLFGYTEGQLFTPFEEECDATYQLSIRDKWEKCPDRKFDIELDDNVPETLSLPKRRSQNLGLGQGIDYRNGKVRATALEMADVKTQNSKASERDEMRQIMISNS